MKRLKENLTNILLIIVVIVCTVCICNKIDNNAIESAGYIEGYLRDNFSYGDLHINADCKNTLVEQYLEDIASGVEYMRQDIDDIGYKLGI